jgi:hypothetical protein
MSKNLNAKFDFKPFLMTPEQHRRLAEKFRALHQNALAKEHELLAHTIARAQFCVATDDEANN